MDRFDLDDLIGLAKKRLIQEGKDVNSLNIYHMVPTIRKEIIKNERIEREQQRTGNTPVIRGTGTE